jgi:hypothetical protein
MRSWGFPIGQLLIVAAVMVAPRSALATTSGTALPLDQYQAGSEQTTLVADGDFESNTKWSATLGEGQIAAPTFEIPTPASTVGSLAFQPLVGNPNGFDDVFVHADTFSFIPGESYVISAYLWNHGSVEFIDIGPPFGPFPFSDLARINLNDGSTNVSIALDVFDGANGGHFVYTTFDPNSFSNPAAVTLSVVGESGANTVTSPYAQIDNVAITLASQFAPPSLIPEPACVGVLTLGAMCLFRRRAASRA